MKLLAPLLIFLGALSYAGPGPAAAGPPETPGEHHEELSKRATSAGSVAVIVELRATVAPEATLPSAAAVAKQRAEVGAIRNRVLDRLPIPQAREAVAGLKQFHLYPGFALQVTPAQLNALLADPEVKAVHEDRLHAPLLFESVALIGSNTSGTFGGYTGNGWVVAILDTGVDKNHPFLSGKVVAEACFSTTHEPHGATSLCPGGAQESTLPDSGLDCDSSIHGCGHGTHVAGIAAGSGNSYSGVAQDAGLIAVQVFSKFSGTTCTNFGLEDPCVLSYTSDYIKGLEFVFGLRNVHDIAAVNMSLGGGREEEPCPTAPEQAPIGDLRLANIATVIASGNSGYTNAMGRPACVPEAVSVGSSHKQDDVSRFSNSAYFLDLLAPGEMIQSSTLGNNYGYMSGTSMAAPHVAGAWAVIRESHPNATVADVLSAFADTGVLITDRRSGAGNRLVPRIRPTNAIAALGEPASDGGNNEDPADPPTPTPIANGQSIGELAGELGSEDFYYIEVPAGASELEISISGGIGDADLYLRHGGLPTLSEFDCRPWLWGNNETCILENPDAGTWYLMLHGYDAYEGVTLTAHYTSEITCHHENHQEIVGRLSNLFEVTACRTITTAEMGLTITSTGDARFTAGERITLRPGFIVATGGRFRAKVAPPLAN